MTSAVVRTIPDFSLFLPLRPTGVSRFAPSGDLLFHAKDLFVAARGWQIGPSTGRPVIAPCSTSASRLTRGAVGVLGLQSHGRTRRMRFMSFPKLASWFVGADNAHALQPRALFQEYEVQLGGTREIIRCKRPQRLSHGRLRRLTGKFGASCGQFFVVVRS